MNRDYEIVDSENGIIRKIKEREYHYPRKLFSKGLSESITELTGELTKVLEEAIKGYIMTKDNRTNEEVLSEFLIANHNLESTLRKIHEYGWTDELRELFDMFQNHYEETKAEILRRMINYGRK